MMNHQAHSGNSNGKRMECLVFDIETVVDMEMCTRFFGRSFSDLAECDAYVRNYHAETSSSKNEFPKQLFHKPVVVGFLHFCATPTAERHVSHLRFLSFWAIDCLECGGRDAMDDRPLVDRFFAGIEKLQPKLISYNGKGFDIPVMRYRAMVHNVQCRFLYDDDMQRRGDSAPRNKYNNYANRYAADWHCDLLEVLSDFGAASRNAKLDETCCLLGMPGKMGTKGSDVLSLMMTGDINGIREYCETDVLNTWCVYLKYMLHTGRITLDNYHECLASAVKYIQTQPRSTSVLSDFGASLELTLASELNASLRYPADVSA